MRKKKRINHTEKQRHFEFAISRMDWSQSAKRYNMIGAEIIFKEKEFMRFFVNLDIKWQRKLKKLFTNIPFPDISEAEFKRQLKIAEQLSPKQLIKKHK